MFVDFDDVFELLDLVLEHFILAHEEFDVPVFRVYDHSKSIIDQ